MFLFLLARAALASLPTARFVVRRSPFPCWQAYIIPVFPLMPAPFCKLFAGLGSTKNLSFLCFSPPLRLSLCSLLRFLFDLKLFSRPGKNCLLPLCYQQSPDNLFSRETMRLKSWPNGEGYSCLLQFLVISLLPSCTYCNASCSRLRCQGHNLLLSSYLTRIGRIYDSSCSACGHLSQDVSHLILYYAATDFLRCTLFGDSLSLQPLDLASGDLWSSAMLPSLERGRVTTTTTK